MSMAEPKTKHALVTGGGTGIGAAIALQMAQEGIPVTISGRRAEPLKKLASQNKLITWVTGDVSDEDSVRDMFTEAKDKNGPVNIVIANAGIAGAAPLAKTDLAMWNAMIAVNLTGVFLTLKQAREDIVSGDWGRMITIASTAGQKGSPYISAYCAAKHGVVGLTRSLAAEFATDNITVNAVCPGFTQTDILETSVENIMRKTGKSEEFARDALKATNPLGRIIQPSEVAASVMWLIGPNSGAITGQTISVSGGETW